MISKIIEGDKCFRELMSTMTRLTIIKASLDYGKYPMTDYDFLYVEVMIRNMDT
jgi:hypothetical protein